MTIGTRPVISSIAPRADYRCYWCNVYVCLYCASRVTTARCRPMLSSLQCSHFTLRTSFIRGAGNRTTAEMTPDQRARRPENAVMHLPQPSCVWSVILRWRILGAAVCTLSAHGTYPISIAVNVRRRYSISDIVLYDTLHPQRGATVQPVGTRIPHKGVANFLII